ncbi:hypothetical protein [Victivallis sp. Marseille-Q1083]|uniref:hypothetical protein n=1 Tax=Victivallis sp. Marseille-Q1083 TaxID=2717288 RepID=UPI00158A723B|nr:hypothetical protein [Victivallis sp. Marseille-Q1083]
MHYRTKNFIMIGSVIFILLLLLLWRIPPRKADIESYSPLANGEFISLKSGENSMDLLREVKVVDDELRSKIKGSSNKRLYDAVKQIGRIIMNNRNDCSVGWYNGRIFLFPIGEHGLFAWELDKNSKIAQEIRDIYNEKAQAKNNFEKIY